MYLQVYNCFFKTTVLEQEQSDNIVECSVDFNDIIHVIQQTQSIAYKGNIIGEQKQSIAYKGNIIGEQNVKSGVTI